MTSTTRGRHRKLRRNILHTVIATALLAGTFTVADQTINAPVANAAVGQAGVMDSSFPSGSPSYDINTMAVATNGVIGVGDAGFSLYSTAGVRTTLWGNGSVTSLATQMVNGTEYFLVGGGTSPILRYSTSGTKDTTFATGQTGVHNALLAYSSGTTNLIFGGAGTDLKRYSQNGVLESANSTIPMGGNVNALAKQNVGGTDYILVGGAFGLKRYTVGGISDSANFTENSTSIRAILVFSDGRILAGGPSGLKRYNADGTIDGTFPVITTPITSLAQQANGGIIAGTSSPSSYIKRFTNDGVEDTVFNSNADDSNDSWRAESVAVAPDGTIIAAGKSNTATKRYLRRYAGSYVAPATPIIGTLTPSDRQVTVSISSGDTSKSVTNFRISAVEDPTKFCDVSLPSAQTTMNSGSCVITGLSNGSPYTFTATATNGDVTSAATAPTAVSTPIDNAGPVFQAAAVDSSGLKLTMTYSEALNSNTAPTSAFTVKNGTATISVSSISVNGSTLELTLASPIGAGLTASVAYTAPAAVNNASNFAIQDLVGNDAVTLSTTNISAGNNQSTVDQTAPTVSSVSTNAAGTEVTLTFNETLSTVNPPLASQFTIANTGGYPTTVSGVNVTGSTVVLSLSSPLGSGTGKTVSYTASTPVVNDTTNASIQDTAGNDAVAITTRAITNSSTVDQTAPTISTVTTNTAGTEVTLTFNEVLLASNPPIASQFSIANTGGYPTTVSGVNVTGSTVVLTLSSPLGSTGSKTVSYTATNPADQTTGNAAIQDAAGNDSLTITNRAITNSSTVDQTAPTISTVTTNTAGTQVTLTFNEALSTLNPPLASQFTIANTGGFPTTVTGVNVSGSTVVLTLSSPLGAGTGKTVSYVASTPVDQTTGNASIQDTSGNDALSLNAQAITNSSTVDQTAPTISTVTTNTAGTQVTLTFNEALSTLNPPLASQFTIANTGGYSTTVTSVTVTGSTVVLNLSSPLSSTGSKTVSYTASTPVVSDTTNASIQDTAGNDAVAITNRAITNSSTVDQVAPTLLSSSVNSLGTTLTMTFSETLSATTAPASAFTVMVNGVSTTPSSVSISGTTAILNFSSPIDKGLSVTVAYQAPAVNDLSQDAAIQDAAGNNTVTFTAQPVTNNSTIDTRGPSLVSSKLDATGTILTLTYDELVLNTTGSMPGAGDYVVLADGQAISVSNVAVDGLKVILTLSPRVYADQVTTVAYVAPTNVSGTANAALQDQAGNDSVSMAATQILVMDSPMKYCTTGPVPTQLVDGFSVASNAGNDTAAFVDPSTITNLVANGTFDTGLESSLWKNIGEFTTRSNRGTIPSWTSKGGGTDTYAWHGRETTNVAKITRDPLHTFSRPSRVYFGNATNSNIKWNGTWTHPTVGWTTAAVDVGTKHSNPIYGKTFADGTSAPVSIEQNVATVPGQVYKMQFFAGAEGWYSADGIAGFAITGYQQFYFKVNKAVDPGVRYTINFVAKSSTTNIKFQNFGHAYVNGIETTELALDTVTMSDCNAPMVQPDISSGAMGEQQTMNLLLSRNGYDTPSDGETLVPSSVKLCASTEVAPNCSKTSLVVNGVGSYSVDALGVMTFTPLPEYIGTPPPISYTVEDTSGAKGTSTYTPTVTPPPMTARPDTTIGPLGATQTIDLSSNDIASTGATITKSSIKLCNVSANPAEVSPNCTVPAGTPVVVAGVGSYVVNSSGIMAFTPEANYVGTPPALPYIVLDSLGSQGASTYTPTVYGPPVARPDTITTSWDVSQTYIPSNNDTAGSGTTLVTDSTKICTTGTSTSSCTGTTLTVTGEGTYTVNTDGTVTFDPLPTFTGTATPIQYVITDSKDQKVTSTITPTILPPAVPSATPDTITTNWDVSQTYTPLSNDTANASFPLLANSVKICATNETPNTCTQTTLTIAGQGTYTVNLDGKVSFDPLPTFTGTATPIKYQANDSLNRFVDSIISPIIGAPPAPSASPDAQSTGYDVTQSYTPTSNDSANTNFPLNLTTVKLCQPATTNPPVSAEVAPNCTLTSLTTTDGVYTVNTTTGEVEFNPASTFSGTVAIPINYQVTDSINRTVTSTITPTIGAPPGPTAVADTSSGNYDTNQAIDPLANDPDNPAIPLLPATLKLCGIDPIETPNNCTQTSLFVPGQGSYVVDPATGLVTFDPLSTFSGTATPIKYQASNASGQVVNSTITAAVGAPPLPTANPDSSTSAMKAVQTVNPLGNDTAGASAIPLDPKSVKLCGINPLETPNDCTKTNLVVAEGTFTVDPVTGVVSFTPVDTFYGTVPPIKYTVADNLGREVSSQIDIVVLPPPAMAAITDLSSGAYNTPQTITPLTNDSPGDLNAPQLSAYTTKGSVETDPTSVRFCGSDDPATTINESVSPNCVATTITTSAGTYTVNATTGVVTFTPMATFTGTDPNAPTYQTCNNVTGTWAPSAPPDTCASALIIPTVGAPPAPVANPDTSTNSYDTNQLINPLTNDTVNANFPLDPTSVKLCGATDVAPNCTQTTLTVLNQGTYTVNPITGVVTFDPLPTFTGVATPISYKVTDSLGRSVSSIITATVGEPPLPTASNDTNTGPFDTDQVISPLTNDSPIAAFPFDQTTVKLCGPDNVTTSGINESLPPNCVALSLTTADGVYTVNTNGTVTFNPDPDFTGTVTQPVTYQVTETKTNGRTASATITPTVGPPPAPVAIPDAQTQPYDTNQTYTPTSNDTSNQYFTVVATSVKLCGADDPATDTNESVPPNCVATTLTVAGEGTYTIGSNGVVTFDPLPSFTGTATPITYQAKDSLDRVINSTITPTVGPPPVAVAVADAQNQPYDTNQTYTPTSNDNANPDFPITASSVKLCGPDNPATTVNESTPPNCVALRVVTADGVYTVDPATGVVTFNPDPDFTGLATEPVKYQATDSLNRVINSKITPTVGPPPVATAVLDAKTSAHDTNQTYTPTSNDTANEYFPINPTSVKLCATGENPPACSATSLTVANQGTYTIDSNTGVVTFDPLPTFTGTATAVTYQATDSLNRVISSTITPTIREPQAVSILPDTSKDAWDVTQTKTVLTNDEAGSTAFPFLANTVKICDLNESYPTCTKTSVIIPNQGTYTVNGDGTISFDPLPTFFGTATPIVYLAGDGKTTDWSTYTPTVDPPPAPTAQPDVTSGAMGAVQSINLLTNTPGADSAGIIGVTIVAASVKLCGEGEASPNCTQTTVTVNGVGTYSVANGVMTFTPEPNYTGTPAPLPYIVLDSTGQRASSTYTPTIIPPPTVVPDTTKAGWDVTQSMNVVISVTNKGSFDESLNTGDSAASGTTLAAGALRLCSLSDVAPNCTVSASGSVVIPNQGTYTVDPVSGVVTFDPLPTFTGTAIPVTYSVTDALGQKSSTTYTPTVTAPPAPTASPDTVELIPGQSKVFSSIFDGQTGDTDPALATKGTGGPDLTNSTVCLLTPGTTTCDADGAITIAGEGTYTLNPTTGIVTYAALSTATPGAKTPITYQITDGLNRTVTSTLTPTITPPPVANPDFSTGVQGAIQTLSPVGNDRPGGGASTELYPDTRAQIPSGIFLCDATQPPPDCAASTVTVTDPVTNKTLGVLTVADSGLVTFTPEPDFIGTTPAIGYQIPDNLGQKAYSTITITVVPPPAPAATIDTGSAEYNKPVTLKPWINDAPGTRPDNSLRSDGTPYPAPSLVATSIKLCDDNSTFIAMAGTTPDCTATKVKTVEGTYEVNATTGEVVFTPVDGFTGTVKYPPTYQIWNNWTGLGGAKSATALLVPTISPPGAPAAIVDVTKTKPGTSVVLNPVANDKPGTAALDPTTVRLCGADEISPACTRMSVTTLDGVYVVDPTTGQVTFTPRDGFIGQATIPYIIKDGLGMIAPSNLIITVEDTAVVTPVAKKTKVGLAKTGGHRPDLLLLLGLVAIAGAGGLRAASRKK